MAKCFDTWTVLEHDPIERLSDKVWTVRGMLGKTQRRMVAVRLTGDRLLIHNPIALGAADMQALESWGRPALILVPNAFHRQDAKIWQDRYPRAKLICPRGARAKVAQLVRVDGDYGEALGDEDVSLFHFRGSKDREGAVLVREEAGASLIVNDCVLNLPPVGGFMGFALGPTGTASVPRVARWMLLSDVAVFAEHLRELSKVPKLQRVIVGHGRTISEDAPATLQAAAARLG